MIDFLFRSSSREAFLAFCLAKGWAEIITVGRGEADGESTPEPSYIVSVSEIGATQHNELWHANVRLRDGEQADAELIGEQYDEETGLPRLVIDFTSTGRDFAENGEHMAELKGDAYREPAGEEGEYVELLNNVLTPENVWG